MSPGPPTEELGWYSGFISPVEASTPLGPAAGPHTQLAQNIVLAFAGGARVFELKTVQIIDTLKIPRPCIDMRAAGYNVEWSQELTLEQSYDEYLKAWMLLHVMETLMGPADAAPGFVFNMSVGYDLAGIGSPRMVEFHMVRISSRSPCRNSVVKGRPSSSSSVRPDRERRINL